VRTQPHISHQRHDSESPDNRGGALTFDCQACGACCSYSADWPRFTTESDEALNMVPVQFVAADQRGMRCDDTRCSALFGRVGVKTSCLVYEARPDVCRACSPGDYACIMARSAFGLGKTETTAG
jgi:Fe-S-cluster containining protein